MDPQFMQLESQLAALRKHQRRPAMSTRDAAVSTPLSSRLTAASRSPRHGRVKRVDWSPRDGVVQTDASSSRSSSSSSVDSTTDRGRLVRDADRAGSPGRRCAGVTPSDQHVSSSSSSSSSLSVAVTGARRQRISEQRSRFRIVKIDSYVDRGRWHCHNFADPPRHDDDDDDDHVASYSTPAERRRGDRDQPASPAPPSQIYYIADGDLSKKFYVSTIVYGVHGHPVLDRTVRVSPTLDMLRRASDDASTTPNTRSRDGDVTRSRADRGVVDETDGRMPATLDRRGDDAVPVSDVSGHVTSSVASETDDVAQNDPPGNPFGGVVMAAHSSMPAMPTSSMTSASDVVSRCPVRSVSLCQRDDVEMRCHDDGFGQLLSVDEDRLATRFASSIW